MKYKGIQSATSVMSTAVRESVFSATWKIDTKTVFNWLFKIHNTYKSEYSLNLCRTLVFEKSIDQKNIQQKLSVKYDWDNLTAITNVDVTWKIPSGGCYDLLSMIYKLRTIEKTKLDSTRFVVDIESQIWDVSVMSLGEESEKYFGEEPVQIVELTFLPFGKTAKRKWKTDLLNNRISKPGAKIRIWLGPYPQRLPHKLRFGDKEKIVEMELKKLGRTD